MSKAIWNINEGWLIPKLPHPQTHEAILAVSPDLSPLHDYQILELIQAANFTETELHHLYDEDDSICAYCLGTFSETNVEEIISQLNRVGIHRDWIVARPMDTEDNIKSRPIPEFPIEYGLVSRSDFLLETA